MSPLGVGVAIAAVVSLGGVPILFWLKSQQRMPNKVPGFGLRYGGDGGHRDASEHSDFLAEMVVAWTVYVDKNTDALVETINGIDLQWRPGDNFVDGTRTLYGVARDPTWIIVAVREGRRIGETALAHEIVHAHLWRHTGDPDRDHSGGALGKGWDARHDRLINDLRQH